MAAEADQAAQERPHGGFVALLRALADGDARRELDTALHGLMAHLLQHARDWGGAKGELTLRLTFAVRDDGLVDTTYAVRCKLPRPRTPHRPVSKLWVSAGGALSTSHPRQLPLVSDGAAVGEADREE